MEDKRREEVKKRGKYPRYFIPAIDNFWISSISYVRLDNSTDVVHVNFKSSDDTTNIRWAKETMDGAIQCGTWIEVKVEEAALR